MATQAGMIDRRRAPAPVAARLLVIPRLIAAALAFGAQGIHLSVLPDQAQLWRGYGLVFLVAAAGQGLLGASLLFDHPSPTTARLGILFNLALIVVWGLVQLGGVASARLLPPPIVGPGLAATILEATLVLLLVALTPGRRRLPPSDRSSTRPATERGQRTP